MRILKLLVALLGTLQICIGRSPDAPDSMKLFLLIGQSNMAGRGIVEEQDKKTDSRVLMLDKNMTWVLAKDPVHFDKPGVAGVGLCSQFARDVIAADKSITVGLVPCAFGGTSLDQWKPGEKLYTDAIKRAREAMKKGTLAGILWHQGESDSGKPDLVASYPDRFAQMIESLRKDLDATNVPVIVGELRRTDTTAAAFNTTLAKIPGVVPQSVVVSSEGLTTNPDNLHFNAKSLREFGSRYGSAYFKLVAGTASANKPAPRQLTSGKLNDNGTIR